MQNTSKVMFVHVPRTAGTSICNFLLKNYSEDCLPRRNPVYAHHDTYFQLALANNPLDFFKFTVVRNPYRRTYSHYKAFLLQLKYNGLSGLADSFSFNDFLKYKRTVGDSLYSRITLNRNNFSIFDQSFYLLDDCGEICLDKIYRFESLKQFEIDFNTNIPHTKKSAYAENEYLNSYDKANTGLVRSLYHRDFSLLNYSTHFDDSL